jgi:Mor family transcriptional regulator
MATTLSENFQKGDHLIFDKIIHYAYDNIGEHTYDILKSMVSDGVLQIETLVEQAISKTGNLKRESVEGRDFADGSDAKKAITQPLVEAGRNSYRRVATIKNILGKHGSLRVVVSETETGKVYYFSIPKHAYQGLYSIRIYFNWDGTPKTDSKWFRYRCDTFEEMCVTNFE